VESDRPPDVGEGEVPDAPRVDQEDVLERLARLPITSWSYKRLAGLPIYHLERRA
jgi:hypothetical protein